MSGQRPPVGACRSCGEPIIWAFTENGKKIPIDLEPDELGNIQLSPGLRPTATVVSQGGREPGTKLHRSHFSSCPHADQHRAPRPRGAR